MRILALLGNLALLAGLAYGVIASPPHDMQGWNWVLAGVAFVMINLLGLFMTGGRLFRLAALFVNGMAIFAWGGMTALMMVWPMGNKPTGLEFAGLLGLWLVLVITEIALFSRVKGRERHLNPGL